MTPLLKLIVTVVALLANIVMAKVQAYRFDKLQKSIDHTEAIMIYMVVTVLVLLLPHGTPSISSMSLWLSAVLMHFPIFSIALNLFRTPRRTWNYHNADDTGGSKWDLWLGKYYTIALITSGITWGALQFLIF